MSNHLLDERDLRVSFDTHAGEVQAVRGVSFWLDQGETLSIVGESGCGKSVTIQTIMKLLPSPPSRVKDGKILYQGTDITDLSDLCAEGTAEAVEEARAKILSGEWDVFDGEIEGNDGQMHTSEYYLDVNWYFKNVVVK